jgi:hypothetical protein
MHTNQWTIERQVRFRGDGFGRGKQIKEGPAPTAVRAPIGRVTRVARLMAPALRFDGPVRAGAASNFAELARLGHVTRARVSQVMNLVHLAPDTREALLLLPRAERGRDRIQPLRPQKIGMTANWSGRRRTWGRLLKVG